MNSTNQTTINTILIIALLILNLVGFAMNMNGSSTDVESAVKKAMHDIQAQQVGGEENYKLVQELQSSDEFKKAQKDQYEMFLSQLKGQPSQPESANNPTANETLTDDQLAMITKDIIVQGDEDAPILLVEYSDIECPFCKRHHENGTVEEILKKHDDVKATFKNFPLSFHKYAQHNAEAIECAKNQADADTVYAFIGALFDADDLTKEGSIAVATDLGLDTDALQSCIDNGEKTEIVAAQMQEGQTVFGVNGTPGNVLINTKTGKYKVVSGAQPYSAFKSAIEELL